MADGAWPETGKDKRGIASNKRIPTKTRPLREPRFIKTLLSEGSAAAQFRNKSIDAFIIGKDVDAVSRPTITMTSAARSVKERPYGRQGAVDITSTTEVTSMH
jgi:hypothetical protein